MNKTPTNKNEILNLFGGIYNILHSLQNILFKVPGSQCKFMRHAKVTGKKAKSENSASRKDTCVILLLEVSQLKTTELHV